MRARTRALMLINFFSWLSSTREVTRGSPNAGERGIPKDGPAAVQQPGIRSDRASTAWDADVLKHFFLVPHRPVRPVV